MMKAPYSVVYQDEILIVLNKTAKIVVHAAGNKEKHTLLSLLAKQFKEKIFPCHRLDRETSGLIVFAKNGVAQRSVMQQFRTKKVRKKYYACVKGEIPAKRIYFKGYILDKYGSRYGEKKKYAETKGRVITQNPHLSLLDLEPCTGRTHQLRIQLAEYGYPILGERVYAFGRDFPVNFKRLALHAYYLALTHPLTKRKLTFSIDFPEDFKAFLDSQGLLPT